MTHEDFNRLYDSGEIAVKVFVGEAPIDRVDADGNAVIERREVEAFEYNGKFFLRLHKTAKWTSMGRKKHRQARLMRLDESHFIKEFETRAQANNYFRKFAEGFNMKRA